MLPRTLCIVNALINIESKALFIFLLAVYIMGVTPQLVIFSSDFICGGK